MKKISYLFVMLMALMVTASCDLIDIYEVDNPTGGGKAKVKNMLVQITGLDPSISQLILPVGGEVEVDVTMDPKDADNKEFTITANNKTLVTTDKNKIKALAPGEVTITITSASNTNVTYTFTIVIPDDYSFIGDESKAVDQSTAESRQR